MIGKICLAYMETCMRSGVVFVDNFLEARPLKAVTEAVDTFVINFLDLVVGGVLMERPKKNSFENNGQTGEDEFG